MVNMVCKTISTVFVGCIWLPIEKRQVFGKTLIRSDDQTLSMREEKNRRSVNDG